MSNPSPFGDETREQGSINPNAVAPTLAPEPTTPAAPGTAVPGYEIMGELGRGGMGVVYKARDLGLKRLVALKMILAGAHAGRDHLERFRTEAEAVARLRHPGIIQIYEVGEHAGLPYLSLELCPGGSLSERLNGTPLPPLAAAALVEQLAQATHHAHTAGIVHRDLKPANVLLQKALATGDTEVTETRTVGGDSPASFSVSSVANALPKITDFGLAKRLDADQGQTASGAIMGTPSYMAPEQAEGKSRTVGPPADIYSLGAILYECLTGRPPFKAATPMETALQVLHEEPVPVRQLNRQVPRDLETICLKCLQKAPARRYATAADLAADLRRYLRGEPVLARPVSGSERAWLWCRRNPGLAVMAVASLVLLVGTLVSVTTLYVRAEAQRRLALANGERAERQREQAEVERARTEEQRRRAETNAEAAHKAQESAEESARQAKLEQQRAEKQQDRALAEADKSRRVTQFITGLFEASDPLGLGGFSFYIPKAMGEKLTAREILMRGAEKIEADKQTPPLIRAAILDAIGNVERSMGDYKTAEKHLEAGLKVREAAAADPLELAQSLFNLAWLRHERGNYVEAEKLYRKSLALRTKHAPDDDALLAAGEMNLGWLLLEMEEYGEAEKLFEDVIKRRQKVWGDDNRETAIARLALASLHLDNGDANKAFPLTAQGLKFFQEQEGNSSLGRAAGLFQTAVFQSMVLRNHKGAEEKLLECLKLTREGLGEGHLYLCFIYGQLGVVLEKQDKPAEAEKWWRQCLDVGMTQVGLEHPKMIIPVTRLAKLLVDRDKGEEAVPLFEKLLKAHRERFGDKHPFVGDDLAAYASLLWDLKRFDERDKAWQEVIAIYQAKPGAPRKQYSETLNYIGVTLSQKGKQAEAVEKYREAVAVEKKLPKPRPYALAQFYGNIGSGRMNLGKFDAETEEALRAAQKALGESPSGARGQLAYDLPMHWCRFHRKQGRFRDLAAAAREAAKAIGTSPERSYAVASELAACVALVQKSGTEAAETKAELRAEYTREALALLKQAVERGYKNGQALKTSPDWNAVRQEQDFKDLLIRVEKAAQ